MEELNKIISGLYSKIDNQEKTLNCIKTIKELKERIDKAIEIIESYNLGKYDYSIPPGGIIDLLEILKGDSE